MRSTLLTAFTVIAIAASANAQSFPPDYRFEAGLNIGTSVNTLPNGPLALYTGTKTQWAPEASLRFHYSFSPYWQVGGDLGYTNWTTIGNWSQNDVYGKPLQSQRIKFVISDPTITVAAQANRVVPFYSKYKEYNKANFYYGATLGVVFTVNDAGSQQSKYNSAPDPNFTYTSQYNYGNGIGYVAGVQAGFTYYISEMLGINIEGAARFTEVGTTDTRYDHANSHYNLFYFPMTVGFRIRF
jgi:hypothetical protein